MVHSSWDESYLSTLDFVFHPNLNYIRRMQNGKKTYTFFEKACAWGVHLFTASGIIFAMLAILAIARHDFVWAMYWLIIAFIIDAVDGMLARKFRVLEVLPYMQGKNIDFVIDFSTYAIIPAYFLYEGFWMVNGEKSYLLPEPEWIRFFCIAILLLVSAVYYGKEPMVSEDMYFIGFPVMWNAVAYYLFFIVRLDPWINFILIMIFSILHFVPLKYAYPSQNKNYQFLNWTAAIIFLGSNAGILYYYPNEPMWMRIVSGLYLPFVCWQTMIASKK